MRFASLGSGSKGNATLVQNGDTLLLIDCGFGKQELVRRLAERELLPTDIDAVLVTHEHADHLGGVGALARGWHIPVYLTHGTAATGRMGDVPRSVFIQPGQHFTIGDISVTAVAVPHDAREPVQFVFTAGGVQLGVLTDLGSITPHVVQSFGGCHALLLEFNHCPNMLRLGPYPAALKRRVGGDWGHLNNGQAAGFLNAAEISALHTLVVGHISEQNNSVERARAALQSAPLPADARVVFANQGEGFDWLSCSASAPVALDAAG